MKREKARKGKARKRTGGKAAKGPPPWRPLPAARRRRLVALLKALGDGTRLEILRLVAASPEPLPVAAVTHRFRLSQPTISHHLGVLRGVGLVAVEKDGRRSLYRAVPDALRESLDPS